jgi:hypothetical protein
VTQAVSRLARILTAVDRNLPAARLVSPTLEFLQAVGRSTDKAALGWILTRAHRWCALAGF